MSSLSLSLCFTRIPTVRFRFSVFPFFSTFVVFFSSWFPLRLPARMCVVCVCVRVVNWCRPPNCVACFIFFVVRACVCVAVLVAVVGSRYGRDREGRKATSQRRIGTLIARRGVRRWPVLWPCRHGPFCALANSPDIRESLRAPVEKPHPLRWTTGKPNARTKKEGKKQSNKKNNNDEKKEKKRTEKGPGPGASVVGFSIRTTPRGANALPLTLPPRLLGARYFT